MSAGYELLLVRPAGVADGALTGFLAFHGHEVTAVAGPEDLEAALATRVPDAVLLDTARWDQGMAPVLAALDAAELSGPVVLLGGIDLDELEAFRSWADRTALRLVGGLHGPFSPDEFLEVLGSSVLREVEFTEADVLDGLAAGEVRARFAPRASVLDGRIIGHEARLVWEHPYAGRLTAAEILPRLSSGRAARALTRWLAEQAVACLGPWLREHPTRELVLPLGAADLLDEQQATRLVALVEAAGLQPGQLLLEVGDLRPLLDPLEAAPWLDRLSSAGLRVSVGDHGGDGWGETLVARGCVHELRLDRRLVSRAVGDGDARVVAWLAVRAASLLGVRVAAQGVDDRETLELLRALGVDRIQGAWAGSPREVGPRAEHPPLAGSESSEERCA